MKTPSLHEDQQALLARASNQSASGDLVWCRTDADGVLLTPTLEGPLRLGKYPVPGGRPVFELSLVGVDGQPVDILRSDESTIVGFQDLYDLAGEHAVSNPRLRDKPPAFGVGRSVDGRLTNDVPLVGPLAQALRWQIGQDVASPRSAIILRSILWILLIVFGLLGETSVLHLGLLALATAALVFTEATVAPWISRRSETQSIRSSRGQRSRQAL